MKQPLKNSFIKLIFSIFIFSALFFQKSYAGGVTGWGATDGFSTVTVAKRDFVIDVRMNATFPGKAFVLPVLNVIYGLTDFMEVGVGTGLNFTTPFPESDKVSMQSIYPWVRMYVPLCSDSAPKVRLGLMFGTLIPLYNSVTAAQPGVSALLDINTNAGTFGANLGYSRTIPETVSDEGVYAPGSNVVSANLNYSYTFEHVIIYEEQFINHFVNGDPNGGFRLSALFSFNDGKIILDINPAVLWINVGDETDWYFSPNIGASFTF